MIQRIKCIDVNKVKQAADAAAKVIDVVVGIVMSVMLGIVGIQQNLSMEKQEEQFAALQAQMNEQAQSPVFRIAEAYDADGFTGYTLFNDGRLVSCLDIKLEKWLYIQTRGEVMGSFIVPYQTVSLYMPAAQAEQNIDFLVERSSVQQTEMSAADEMPEESELPVRLDLMDVKPFVNELQSRLQQEEKLGYSIRTMEILTLSFIDKEQTHQTQRYFIAAQTAEEKSSAQKERMLYVLDEGTWGNLLTQIPNGFERPEDTLNSGIYADLAKADFQWRHADEAWQQPLVEQIAAYIVGLKQPQ